VITTIVQIRCSRDLIPQCAEAIAELPGIAEVYSVSGDYDLMAILKVKNFDDIAAVVTEQMVKVPGIVRTNTISAFRVYSRTDKEAGFTLGGA
jgi:DNA-binding Lrp family transcriptional regulator